MSVTFRDGPLRSNSSNGVPYVTLINGFVHEEGEGVPRDWGVFEDKTDTPVEDAQALFDAGLKRFLAMYHAKTVEWRSRPAVEHSKIGRTKRVYVRARLAVVEQTKD